MNRGFLLCLSKITFMNDKEDTVSLKIPKKKKSFKIFTKYIGISVLRTWSFVEDIFLIPDGMSSNE